MGASGKHLPPHSTPETGAARVLVASLRDAAMADALRELGCEVMDNHHLTADTLPGALHDLAPDVLVVGDLTVSATAMDATPQLALVIHAGSGQGAVDVSAASARGILVANCPTRGAVAAAELAWGLILACDRRIPEQANDLRAGRWNRLPYLSCSGLNGRTLGLIGFGAVGQEVARRGRAFGMHVLAWSRSLTEERCDLLHIDLCSNLVNLAKLADVISVSVTGSDQTHHMLGEKFFAAMRPGAILVNTSLGTVIDEAALQRAISDKGIRVGLDVFSGQPTADDGSVKSSLLANPGVYATHGVGGWTTQARSALAEETSRILAGWMHDGHVFHCLNDSPSNQGKAVLRVRHANRPGVLARVFEVLGRGGVNIEEMENVICAGGEAAIVRMHLASMPTDAQLREIRATDCVFAATAGPSRLGG